VRSPRTSRRAERGERACNSQDQEFQGAGRHWGGRTITWGSNFKTASWTPDTAASKINVIAFVWNGTYWLQTESVVGL
jgi:hypothetical protein